MTIAACYLSAEGVVFGADSTSTMFVTSPGGVGSQHHYNYAQKIFRLGDDGSLAITMWGLGNLQQTSYRTLIARFADELRSEPAISPQEVADRWAAYFWHRYSTESAQIITAATDLAALEFPTSEQQELLSYLVQSFSGGFCLGGHLRPDRTPFAFEINYSPTAAACDPPRQLATGSTSFWGCPNLMERLIDGIDGTLFEDIGVSGKWVGTPQELAELVRPYRLGQPFDLPIREAIDWVFTSIYTTNQAMKFSHFAPVCGGPVEVAVITTDRPFRWVRHKKLDAAIASNGIYYDS
jgi:hypothetical protein